MTKRVLAQTHSTQSIWFEDHSFKDIFHNEIYKKEFNPVEQIKLSIVCKFFLQLKDHQSSTLSLYAICATKSCYCGHLDYNHTCHEPKLHTWYIKMTSCYTVQQSKVEKIGIHDMYSKIKSYKFFVKLNHEIVSHWNQYPEEDEYEDDENWVITLNSIKSQHFCINGKCDQIWYINPTCEDGSGIHFNQSNLLYHIMLLWKDKNVINDDEYMVLYKRMKELYKPQNSMRDRVWDSFIRKKDDVY